jgi:hypothetical protein
MDLSAYDEPAPPAPAVGLFGAQPPVPPPTTPAAPRFGLSAPSSPSLAPAPADLDLARKEQVLIAAGHDSGLPNR